MPIRNRQPLGRKGSLKWTQVMVNHHPDLLSAAVADATRIPADVIEWVSPVAADDHAEYRDQGFLARLDLHLDHFPLQDFWPARGPQWDALAKAGNRVILVEAKAHLLELISPATQAGPASLGRIRASLELVKKSLGVSSKVDWTGTFYQYANRLAHLFLLRELNRVPAELVHVCFLNDREMHGPTTAAEWQAALIHVHQVLGIVPNPLLQHLYHVFIDVSALSDCVLANEPVMGEVA